jgi:hypothetical protein
MGYFCSDSAFLIGDGHEWVDCDVCVRKRSLPGIGIRRMMTHLVAKELNNPRVKKNPNESSGLV